MKCWANCASCRFLSADSRRDWGEGTALALSLDLTLTLCDQWFPRFDGGGTRNNVDESKCRHFYSERVPMPRFHLHDERAARFQHKQRLAAEVTTEAEYVRANTLNLCRAPAAHRCESQQQLGQPRQVCDNDVDVTCALRRQWLQQ